MKKGSGAFSPAPTRTNRPEQRSKKRLPALSVQIAWRIRRDWNARALLARVAREVAAAEGFHTGELSIAVVGTRAMTTLHRRYKRQSGPTDVLAFDFGSSRRRGYLDGEIVVCADVALRMARRRHRGVRASRPPAPRAGSAPREQYPKRKRGAYASNAQDRELRSDASRAELALYVAHGCLHLAGYDDHTPAAFRRMHAREDQLLAQLGLGRVFAGE